MTPTPELIYIPALDGARDTLAAPIHEVTLLEDRAVVRRRAPLELAHGARRFVVHGVAPVLQDVSLRAEILRGAGRVSDARVRRAVRLRRDHQPAEVRAIEQEIERLLVDLQETGEGRSRAEARQAVIAEMLAQGLREIPEDASWGMVNAQSWHDTVESLFKRSRQLQSDVLDAWFRQQDLIRDVFQLSTRRGVMARPDERFVACVELDVIADEPGAFELELSYTVPNALWRPIHSARLSDGAVDFRSSAAVWQNTGEDWDNAKLVFSTARTSLGTDPPLLSSDLLYAQPRAQEVRVAARQVEIQTASVEGASGGGGGGATPLPAGIDLPGVDDGGDIQNLRATSPVTIRSDGRPTFVPIFRFKADANLTRVAMPELDIKVFLRGVLTNASPWPLLAGPVEIIRGSEVVGWTQTLFVAPGERFELSFGPEHDMRILRNQTLISREVHPVDRWTRQITELSLYLSNLGDTEVGLYISERIPVSEVEHVRIQVLEEGTNFAPTLDDNGICTWDAVVPPRDRRQIVMRWELALAPGVQGL